jgi:transglutaminase-like putative cysteine protease
MPVILEVEHTTTYRYSKAVEFSEHRVAFHPRAAHDISVLHAELEVYPHCKQRWIHDVFSNSIAVVEPLVPAQELSFRARFIVEHHGVKNLELPIAPEAKLYPFDYSTDDRADLSNFLLPQYPDDKEVLLQWVARFLPERGRIHTRDILNNINEAIWNDFKYLPREAEGTQRPALTLQLKTGTCRDFALLMIEAARGLGLAARFVSGYIYDPILDSESLNDAASIDGHEIASKDIGGRVGSGATHAWLHIFLPGAGWIPFDPTNSISGGTDLIRVAYTRTPEQAAPVSGSWTGTKSDFLGMSVDVKVRRIASLELSRLPNVFST